MADRWPGGEIVKDVSRPLLVCFEVRFEKIREEKQFDDDKQNEQLDQHQFPEGPTCVHGTESVPIKLVNSVEWQHVGFHIRLNDRFQGPASESNAQADGRLEASISKTLAIFVPPATACRSNGTKRVFFVIETARFFSSQPIPAE